MPIISTTSITGLLKKDPQFQTILDTYGQPPNWSRPEGFATLVKIILEQQVSLSSAEAAYLQLVARLGSITPQNLLSLDQEEMRACYVSRQKSSYLHALSNAVLDESLDLTQLHTLDDDQIHDQLTNIKGIGPWTAQCYMIFALQRPDIFPRGDVALNNTVKELWPVKDTDAIYSLSAHWSPYRSTAAFLLWHFYLRKRNRQWK